MAFRFPRVTEALWTVWGKVLTVTSRDVRRPQSPRPWTLGAKQEVLATALVRNDSDRLGRFMLALAAIYNDLKGAVLFENYLLAFKRPAKTEWTPTAGQWRGVHVQIHRMIAGIMHELLSVIAADLGLANREVRALVPPDQLAAWDEVVVAARGKGPDGKATNSLLHNIRNKVGFHYDIPDLAEGYKEKFVTSSTGRPHDRSAQFSYGPDMDATRFFYADAAAQRVLQRYGLAAGLQQPDSELVKLAAKVNNALAPTIAAFIRQREAEAPPRGAPGDRETLRRIGLGRPA